MFGKRQTYGQTAIGCDLFTRKKVDLLNHDQSIEPVFLCVAADAHGFNDGLQADEKGGSDKSNDKSIVALVYWPADKRCSFYTGGDGNPVVAQKSIAKLFANLKTPPGITAMKLDHHGSSKRFNQPVGDVAVGSNVRTTSCMDLDC